MPPELTIPALVDVLGNALRPRDLVTLPDWMDRHIILERGGFEVPWQTSKTPYLRDIMLDLSVDSPVEEVVVMKPSQVGASEMAIGFHCYMADVAPCNMITIQPDLDAAARFKKLRIDPVIRKSPRLRGIFREKKSRDAGNTQHELLFDGGAWIILGSNSPSGLASLPSPINSIDELDRQAASAGVGMRAEGDQYLLLRARTNTFRDTFPRRKLLRISSPGDKLTSKIEPAYFASDRRRYHVPCSACGTPIVFKFSRLWWGKNDDPRTARYRCQVCDRLLDEHDKPEMLARGKWIAEDPNRDVRGYKLTGLDSPFLRWGEMAAEGERVKGNPNELRVYVNTTKGETYDTLEETRVDVHALKLLSTPIVFENGRPVIPRGVGLLTAGADTQPDRLEQTLRGWGKGEEQWHLDHVIFRGDASAQAVWDDMDTYMRAPWRNELGVEMGLHAACIDCAGRNTMMAYDFVRGKGHRRVWGIWGRGGQGKRPWPRKPSRNNKGRIDLYLIGVDGLKTQLYARLKASIEQVQRGDPPGGPGFVHIAAHLCEDQDDGSPSDYLQQLVAEVTKTKHTKSGTVVEWELPPHKRNEALDCDIYAQAALAGLKAMRWSIEAAVERMNPAGAPPVPPEIVISSSKSTSPNLDEIPKATPTPPSQRAAPPQIRKVPRYIDP